MIAKLVWKLLEDPDCPWARLMHAKYLKTGSFWDAKRPANCSSTWSAMLKCRDDMRDGCCWRVGNGANINI